MVINCSNCGKQIYVSDGWTLHQRDYEDTLCSECKEKKQKLKNK